MKALLLIPALTLATSLTQAQVFKFEAVLNGASEAPANASTGTGFATFVFDETAHTLQIDVSFANLVGNTTASHIHAATALAGAGTAGVATQTPSFSGFPLGVKSGTYSHLFDLSLASSFNAAYVTAHGGTAANAEKDLVQAALDGKAYLNIHSTSVGSGEIRGFLVAVPEPTTTCAVGAGLLGTFALVRRTRRSSAQ